MAMIEPDYSQVVELTPGRYEVRVTDVKLIETAKGQKMLKWKLEVENNPDPKLNGKVAFHNTMLEGAGAGIFKAFVRATLNPAYSGGGVDTDECLGKSLGVVIVDGTSRDGSPSGFPEVKSVFRLDGTQAKTG